MQAASWGRGFRERIRKPRAPGKGCSGLGQYLKEKDRKKKKRGKLHFLSNSEKWVGFALLQNGCSTSMSTKGEVSGKDEYIISLGDN